MAIQISQGEAVDTSTGELIDVEQLSRKWQQYEGINYAEAHADVPLKNQNVLSKHKLRVVITGKFDVARREIISRLNHLGISVGSGVNGKTDLLVVGEWGLEVGAKGVSNKFLDAKKKGVQVEILDTAQQVIQVLERRTGYSQQALN